MTPSFEKAFKLLKQMPGLGHRSAERIALHLLLEQPDRLVPLLEALREASQRVRRCLSCGNLTEEDYCEICLNPARKRQLLCIVEQIPDLYAMERSSSFYGTYHVLHGKLSPIRNIGPEQLNLEALRERILNQDIEEVILALSNDIEGEATCHYIQDAYLKDRLIRISRIGFGLPSGSGLLYADPATLKSALESRRDL